MAVTAIHTETGAAGLPAVIRRLLRDLDVMRMAFFHTGIGNLNEL